MGAEKPQNIEDLKKDIIVQTANLSRLLGMIPGNDAAVSEARSTFLKLTILIGKALNIQCF